MPAAKKRSGKAQVKVKDLKAKKNPKGGLNYAKKTPNVSGLGGGHTIKIHF